MDAEDSAVTFSMRVMRCSCPRTSSVTEAAVDGSLRWASPRSEAATQAHAIILGGHIVNLYSAIVSQSHFQSVSVIFSHFQSLIQNKIKQKNKKNKTKQKLKEKGLF